MQPLLLLVEDEPLSQAFLRAALEALPARVEVAASAAQAEALPGPHDLWLIDANLPDASGPALLRRLRARAPATPALAHTADHNPALHRALRAAGFDAVLAKPIGTAELHARVRALLPGPGRVGEPPAAAAPPCWDDARGLAALGGKLEHLRRLRELFISELPGQCARICAAIEAGQLDPALAELHRLKAGSGFVGAARVQAAASALQAAPTDAACLRAFRSACAEALA